MLRDLSMLAEGTMTPPSTMVKPESEEATRYDSKEEIQPIQ